MLAQNISVCGNLFTKNSRAFLLNDEEKFLSSSEIINATGVVQKSVARRTSHAKPEEISDPDVLPEGLRARGC
jgi:hypothetical protein